MATNDMVVFSRAGHENAENGTETIELLVALRLVEGAEEASEFDEEGKIIWFRWYLYLWMANFRENPE